MAPPYNSDVEDFFFTVKLTENEHWVFEEHIDIHCLELGLSKKYYRKFKTGHVPTWRECKVIGPKPSINRFKRWLSSENLGCLNYYSTVKKAISENNIDVLWSL